MNSSFNRQQVRCLCVALAAAAFAAPAAQAHHAPGEDPGDNRSASIASRRSLKGDSATQWNASPLEIDRLGPKHVPLHHPMSAAPVDADRPGPTAAGTAIANARHDAMPVSVVKLVRPSRLRLGRRRYRRWRRQPDACAGRNAGDARHPAQPEHARARAERTRG